jgi:predicted RecB family endonuclease
MAPASPPTPGSGPTAANPSSGTDWNRFFQSDWANWVRTPLEVLRVVPGWGLITGAVADLMNIFQNQANLSGEEAPVAKTLMAVRDVVALVNGGLTHLKYVTQLVQDGVVVSGVFAELAALTGPLNEGENSVKMALDALQLWMDTCLIAVGKYEEMHAPPGPHQDAWKNMVNTYMASGIGDLVTVFLDLADLATAGASQGGVVKEGSLAFTAAIQQAKYFKQAVIAWIQGLNGIWGSKIPFSGGLAPGGAPAQRSVAGNSVQRDAAGPLLTVAIADAIITELGQVKVAYATGTLVIDKVADDIQKDVAQLDQFATALNAGQDPFKQAQAEATQRLSEMTAKIGELHDLVAVSTTAEEKAKAIGDACDTALGVIKGLTLPQVSAGQPGPSTGVVGEIAGAVEALAADAVKAFMDKLQTGLDDAKAAISEPILSIKAHAGDAAEFFNILQQTAADQVAWIQDHVADFTARLAKCDSFQDMVNLVLHEVSEALGLDQDLDVATLKADWAELGNTIDEAATWAQQLKAAAETESAAQGPTSAAPPANPNDVNGGPGAAGASPPPTAQTYVGLDRVNAFLARNPVDVPAVQRSPAVDTAIAKNTVDAVTALSDADLGQATVDERVKMIDIVLAGGGGEQLSRLWASFGGNLQSVANSNGSQWEQSFKKSPDVMRKMKEVTGWQAAFKDDICTVAQGYLSDNDQVVKQKMESLGIPEQADGAMTPTAAQDAALKQTQADAAEVDKLQKQRDQLRTVEIAYHHTQVQVEMEGKDLPPGGAPGDTYDPVYFDPDKKFELAGQPDYVVGVKTWEETNGEYVNLTNSMNAYLSTNPALYALVRSDTAGTAAGTVATASPEQARKTLGEQLRSVRDNIAKTRPLVPGLALEMTPIQAQLLNHSVGASVSLKNDWSTAFLKPVGEDIAAQQQPGPWWQELGLAALEMAAYVVAGLATGGIGPLLLAGGQAAISIGHYEALAAASRANATPDTVLVKDGQVQAAEVEAVIATAMAFLTLVAGLRAAFMARIASQAGQTLAKEVGEDTARWLLLDLAPDAATALKDKLGADLLKTLSNRVSAGTVRVLAEELAGTEIQALVESVGWDALERLTKSSGGRVIQKLVADLGGDVVKSLGEEIPAADIQAMIGKHGTDGVKWLGKDLAGNAAKQLAADLEPDVVKALQDITSKEAADLAQNLGQDVVNGLAKPLKGGKNLQELGQLKMFKFQHFQQAIANAAAVKSLGPLEGEPLNVIEQKLTNAGFTKIAAGDQQVWTHADGSVVRVKVGGSALYPEQPKPHMVREIAKVPGRVTGQGDIIAKVTEDGTVIPKGRAKASDDLQQWFRTKTGSRPTQTELVLLMNVWAAGGHVEITVP